MSARSHGTAPAAVAATEHLLRTPERSAPRNVLTAKGPTLFPGAKAESPFRPERHTATLLPLAHAAASDAAHWEDLASRAGEPSPLFEPWVALPLLEGRDDVLAAQVWGGDAKGCRRLDGLMLLQRARVGGRLGYLRTWSHSLVPLGAPLVREGAEHEVAGALLDLVERQTLPLLRLDQVPADGPFHRALVHQCWLRQWPLQLAECFTRAVFRPARDAESFVQAALSGKRRRELRKGLERLQAQGGVRFTQLDSPDALSDWTQRYAQLEGRGWKGQEGVAVGAQELGARQFEEILRGALLRGRLQFLALEVDGRKVAMNVALLAGEGGFGLKTTYDEALGRFMPGVQLYLHQLELLHRTPGLRWMDSCASPDRQLMNGLWPHRRALQSLIISADRPLASAFAAALPLTRWARRWLIDRAPSRARFDAAG